MLGETVNSGGVNNGGVNNGGTADSLESPAGVLSDDALLLATARGDRDAFRAFVTRTQPAVLQLAIAILGNSADAEDVAQETYLAAFRGAAQFRGDAAVLTWLLKIARRQAWHHVARRREPLRDLPALEALALAAGWGSEDPERIALRSQDHAALRRALSRLPSEYREILNLRDIQGMPGTTVATVLGLSVPAMKSRLHRARLSLAASLREDGYHA